MVMTKLLVVASLPHESYHFLFLEPVEVYATSLLGFTFVVELYVWSPKGVVGGEDGL
jgi:hypothetical protein